MTRILSSIILIPLALLVVIYAPRELYLAGIGIIGTICLYEFSRIMQAMNVHSRTWFLYCVFWVSLVGFYSEKISHIALLALVVIIVFTSSLWRKKLSIQQRTFSLLAELFGILYITLFLYPALPIRYAFGNKVGLQWTLLMLLVIWGGDTFALVIGKTFGKRPFAPVLSPNKTKEGALFGLLAGIGIAVVLQHFLLDALALHHVLIASFLLGLFGQIGDLAESMLKRAAGIKDSSKLIPGHGGVLDRMDSLLFAIPILYAYLLLIYR